VVDSHTSLIFINSLIFMEPTAVGSKRPLGATGVREGLPLGCRVRAAVTGVQWVGAYCVATCTA